MKSFGPRLPSLPFAWRFWTAQENPPRARKRVRLGHRPGEAVEPFRVKVITGDTTGQISRRRHLAYQDSVAGQQESEPSGGDDCRCR